MKKMLGLVLGTLIAVGFVAPTVSLASEQSVPQSRVEVSTADNSQGTFENFKSFVDSKISFDGKKFVLNDPEEIKEVLINNESQISLEIGSEFSGAEYFNYITQNIEDMNAKLAGGSFHVTADNGIGKNTLAVRKPAPEKPYQLTSHWWGIKFQSFGPKGTIDLKTMFLNSTLVQGAVVAILAFTPAAVLSVFPIISGAYDGMIANSIQGEIDKGTDKKGISVDINNWVPTYSVYPN
ncbi:hypothetical protein JZO66_07025 [Enterococcus sp. DIV0242_7C1]|uniref:Uncharacterized protein n=1 Tax=Candidatus Enterococcus dunnyi TaxID=1834192 RepID=A0AAQ3W3U9_9ENTE|nr:hypothetical protein [Enterococcus sp. DIV0242_7C1]MBO0470292.1 hypothetical protein [Enterococcus sp. DIV0242_7C1]